MTTPNLDAVNLKISRKRILIIIIIVIIIIILTHFSPHKHFRSLHPHTICLEFRYSLISLNTAFSEELKDSLTELVVSCGYFVLQQIIQYF